MIIQFTDTEDSPWDTEEDSISCTSTPDFKHGKHSDEEKTARKEEDKCIIQLILKEGMSQPVPDWIAKRKIKSSILILADGMLERWPVSADKICDMEYHQGWPLKRWSQAIRLGEIRISHNIVICYFEST